MAVTRDQVLAILSSVRDPEVPVLSVIDLGIVRDILIDDDAVTVKITPTYSGCPALQTIEENIAAALRDKGVPNATIKTVYSPAWTTDWMSEDGKRKLKEYGIAPPGKAETDTLVSLRRKPESIQCPFCDSKQTSLTSQFGSTACKALYFCQSCKQPFEHFKAF
jgi:ring-1,2-phenylacetyl-CoA epoxidase subunit PaaD